MGYIRSISSFFQGSSSIYSRMAVRFLGNQVFNGSPGSPMGCTLHIQAGFRQFCRYYAVKGDPLKKAVIYKKLFSGSLSVVSKNL